MRCINKPKPTPPEPKPYGDGQTKFDDDNKDNIKETLVKQEVVSITKISVNYPKVWIQNESEVEAYFAVLKKAILAEINAGKLIQV